MSNLQATAGVAPMAQPDMTTWGDRLERLGVLSLFGMAVFIQFSIAIGQLMLALASLFYILLLIVRRERFVAPRFFWPLVPFAAATLVSAAYSQRPDISFGDTKQLVLFFVVPVAYRFASGSRGATLLTLIMSLGAASAAFGIFQYGLMHYDQLSQRPQGTLGHYMTYSGLLMLVIVIAVAKLLFGKGERLWAALVMPALVMAIALTSTRTAWIGVAAGAAVLLMLKDFRLLATLPVMAVIVFSLASPRVTTRVASIFDTGDPTRRDRVAMLKEGALMVRTHPFVGVGPDMVKERYAEFRVPEAVEEVNPHLHNVPMQIAAERGLPALGIWIVFVGLLWADLARLFKEGRAPRVLLTTAAGALVAMLVAGLFEYNFGDSEFLMMFLLIMTLPFAAMRQPASHG